MGWRSPTGRHPSGLLVDRTQPSASGMPSRAAPDGRERSAALVAECGVETPVVFSFRRGCPSLATWSVCRRAGCESRWPVAVRDRQARRHAGGGPPAA